MNKASVSGGFGQETSDNFYEDLSNALTWVPNYRKIYSVYNIVFHRVVKVWQGGYISL